MRQLLLVALATVAACTAPEGEGPGAPSFDAFEPLPNGDAVGLPLMAGLSMSLTQGLVAGDVAIYTASGADPGETVFLAASVNGVGSGPCFGFLGSLCLDLLPPVMRLGGAVADAQGTAVFNLPIPAAADGRDLSVQVVARRGAGGAQSVKSAARTDTVGGAPFATGLQFPGNGEAGSDIRLVWGGADLLPRVGHTAIIRYLPSQQSGYYATMWHSPSDGTWDFGDYSWGTHPYPGGDGSVNGDGQALNGQGSVGTDQYWESAGLDAAADFLASPGGASVPVVMDQWYVQIRRCRQIVGGPDAGMYEHVFVPDYLGNPGFRIRQLTATVGAGGADPAFYLGASDWTSGLPFGPDQNLETPSGVIRGVQLYATWLSDADVAVEAANDTVDAPQTAAGLASVHYLNQNPTPGDVADRSGQGHDPVWANVYRPTLWEE